MTAFARYIGIDYSGAQTPTSSLKGLRVYSAIENQLPQEVSPLPSQRRYWTRRGVAEWLNEILSRGIPTLVGIDHAFSFPIAYFNEYKVSQNWDSFLDDFCFHWPTDVGKFRGKHTVSSRSIHQFGVAAINAKTVRLTSRMRTQLVDGLLKWIGPVNWSPISLRN